MREHQGEETAITLLAAIHERGVSPAPDSVRAWLLRSPYHGGEPTLAEGTLLGMIQTGSLGLIQDRSLRSALAAFSSQLPRDLDLMRYWADTAFRTLVTNAYFKREVGAYELFSDDIRRERGLPTSNRFPVDFSRLGTENEFGGLAQDAYIMRRNRRLAVERLVGAGRAVLQDLDRVLAEGTYHGIAIGAASVRVARFACGRHSGAQQNSKAVRSSSDRGECTCRSLARALSSTQSPVRSGIPASTSHAACYRRATVSSL